MRPEFTLWQPAPAQLVLPPATIDLWRADLDRSVQPDNVLSPDESVRAARLLIPEKARRFVTGRTLLRLILGRYLALPPEALHFQYNPHGKPFLPGSGVEFNLAHSGCQWLLAIASQTPLGIDVECVDPLFDWRSVAPRIFLPDEYAALKARPPHRQRRAFYRMWTHNEAFLKGLGSGFATSGQHLVHPHWFIRNIPVGRHSLAALATATPPRLIRRFIITNSTGCP